jgi:hypothetical protein
MTAWPQTLIEADEAVAPVVLIVEDEVLVRLAASRHLRRTGYDVLEASNAAEALCLLDKVDVDVVFCDVVMPGRMDGQPAAGYGMFLSKPYRLIDLDFCLVNVLQKLCAD